MKRRTLLGMFGLAWLIPLRTAIAAIQPSADVIVSVDRGDKGQVFDANGISVEKCIEANLTTGRCVCFVVDGGGGLRTNPGTHEPLRIVDYPPMPLTFVRNGCDAQRRRATDSGCDSGIEQRDDADHA